LAQVSRTSTEASILGAAIKDVRLLNGLGDVPLWQLTGGNGQVVPNVTVTLYNGWTYSDYIGIDLTAVPGEVVIRTPGRYIVTHTSRFTNAGTTAAERSIFIEQVRNGSVIRRPAVQTQFPAATGGGPGGTASGTARCQAGDILRGMLYQASGGNLNLNDTYAELSFTGAYIGP